MKNWYLNILILGVCATAFYYAVVNNFPEKQWTHWLYKNTIIGYTYDRSFDETQSFYNIYYLDDFKIDKPVAARFSHWDDGKVYVFSEDIASEYLKDTANFILREDVYEYYRYTSPETIRYTVQNWKYSWCSLPIPNYEEEFEAKFKFRAKIGGLEISDFLIKPKGFVCILAQTPIFEWWEDVGTLKGFEKPYQPYVIPYFSYQNSEKYYNMVMDNLMTEEYYERQEKLFGPIEHD